MAELMTLWKKNVFFVCSCVTGALKPCDSNSICFTRINLCYIKCTITLLILLFFQIKKIKRSDAALRGELMPYNIVPLDAPSSVANIIGFFPEVWICTFGFETPILIINLCCTMLLIFKCNIAMGFRSPLNQLQTL